MKTNFKKISTFVSALALNAFVTAKTYAVEVPLPESPTPDDNLIDFVYRMINLAIGLAGLIAVVFLIYNGIRYILSAGDEAKVEKATKGITYAIIGLVICFVSVLIVNFILNNVIQVS